MEFRVGDLVEVYYGDEDYNMDGEPEEGSVGTVIKNDSDGTVLVSFEGFDGHTTDEEDAWWVWKRHLKPASSISKIAKTVEGGVKDMTEIEKLSKEAIFDIYQIAVLSCGDDVDDLKAVESIIARYNSDVEQIKIEEELAKRPFKVGNIITGKPDSKKAYGHTTHDAVMRVDEVLEDGYIQVTILEHIDPDREDSVNRDYKVEEKWFRRVI